MKVSVQVTINEKYTEKSATKRVDVGWNGYRKYRTCLKRARLIQGKSSHKEGGCGRNGCEK